MKEAFTDPRFKKSTKIGLFLMACQNFTAVSVFNFFSNQLFENVQKPFTPYLVTALYGLLSLISTLTASFVLNFIGRKPMLVGGFTIIACCLFGLGISTIAGNTFGMVICILCFVTTYYLTTGPVIWIYIGEVMCDSALSLAVCLNWVLILAIASILPFVSHQLSENPKNYGYIWIFCGILCVFAIVFVVNCIIETRGLTKEQIQNKF